MSSMVETAAEQAAEEKLPEEEEKKPLEEEKKNLGEEDKEPQVTSSTTEKMQVPVDTDEPTSEGGNAVIKKDQTEEHLLAVAEEDDGKVKLHEKKVKKRKRRELQQIKQEKLVSDVTVQEHLLAVAEEDEGSEKVKLQEKKVKKRKKSELQQNKEEVQVDAGVPLRWCASYCTLLLRRSQTPRYKGSIILDPELNRVALLDTNEMTIDCRHLKEGELIYPGIDLFLTDHRSRLKSKMVEALICLQDWLKAADPKTKNKDAAEEECLVFYQLKKCHEETAAQQVNGGSTVTLL